MAMYLCRRRQYNDCIDVCSELLKSHPGDQSALYLKCKALADNSWVDDADFEEEGAADFLLDLNRVATTPR